MRRLETKRRRALVRLLVELALSLVVLVEMEPAQAPPSLPPEKIAEALGQKIHYYEAGQGPNVIFLHGLGGDAGMWAGSWVVGLKISTCGSGIGYSRLARIRKI